MVRLVTQWKRQRAKAASRRTTASVGPLVIWRTRGASHYGPRGFQGFERRGCHALTAAERAELENSLGAAEHHELRETGVRLLDGNVGTLDAQLAHPLSCAGGDKGNYYDCRHFCQPGPVEWWNRALLDLVAGVV